MLSWPLLCSSVALTISLGWRLVILGFAYSRLVLRSFRRIGDHHNQQAATLPLPSAPSRNTTTAATVADPTIGSGDSRARWDERWPVRCALAAIYGRQRSRAGDKATASGCANGGGTLYLQEPDDNKRSLAQCCGFWLSCVALKVIFTGIAPQLISDQNSKMMICY